MNKFLRYLIFAILLLVLGYVVYSWINKPAVVSEEVVVVEKENIANEYSADPKVSSDTDVKLEEQNISNVEGDAKVAVEFSEDKSSEEVVVPAEKVEVEEVSKEEVNKAYKPAKR